MTEWRQPAEPLSEEALESLVEAMNRYGFTHADMGHTDASCWCKPELRCVQCAEALCNCGAPVSTLHKGAS